jgi:DNA polymerase-3 subunit alpha
MQKVLHAAMRGGTVESVEAEWEYSVIGSYPLSDRQVRDQLIATGLSPRMAEGAIAASAEIGQRCQVTLPKSEPIRYPGTVRELSWT